MRGKGRYSADVFILRERNSILRKPKYHIIIIITIIIIIITTLTISVS